MNKITKIVLAALVLVAVLGGGGFYLFEKNERAGLAGAAGEACGDDVAPSTSTTLPLGLPLTDGAAILRTATQGATTVAFTSIPGDRSTIVEVRDAVLADLKTAGYTVDGTDQEPTYEAEAQISGPHEGSIRVKPLCTGLLEVRYRISD